MNNVNISINMEHIKRKIGRMQERVDMMKKEHGKNPTEKFNYYGGWELGYFEGLISALTDELIDLPKEV